MSTSLFYWNEKHGRTQVRTINLAYSITAAKTVTALPSGIDCLTAFDALTQAQIDAYLGNSSDFLLAKFDATSMGAHAFGGVVNMLGQAHAVVSMEAHCASGTGLATIVSRFAIGSTGLTSTTLETAVGISTAGNIGFKISFGATPDFDALTAGLIIVKLNWLAK